jgi:hypothetical protein
MRPDRCSEKKRRIDPGGALLREHRASTTAKSVQASAKFSTTFARGSRANDSLVAHLNPRVHC